MQALESQLRLRQQRELQLQQRVDELQAVADRLGGAVCSAEAAAVRSGELEQQVSIFMGRPADAA